MVLCCFTFGFTPSRGIPSADANVCIALSIAGTSLSDIDLCTAIGRGLLIRHNADASLALLGRPLSYGP